MYYKNATNILPEKLLIEVQKYIQGSTLYIPKQEAVRKKWGTVNGGLQVIEQRNQSIRERFVDGNSIPKLAEEYFLSVETIKKIVYSKKRNKP